MIKQISGVVVLVIVLAIVLVGCGGGDDGDGESAPEATAVFNDEASQPESVQEDAEPEPTHTPMPTNTPLPAPTATPLSTDTPEPIAEEAVIAAPELDLTNLQGGLNNFSSYRLNINMSISSTDAQNKETNAHIQISTANITEPPATSITITAEGMEEFEQFGSLAMTQIDGVSYISLPELGCITNTEQGSLLDAFGEEFLNTSEITGDLDKARFVDEEVISDIEVLHYEVDTSLLDEEDDLDEIEGDIYVAKDGGYLVQMTLDGTGPVDFLGQGEDSYGTVHMEYNLTDINESFAVSLPKGCDESAAGNGSEYPVTEDAYDLSSFSGFTSYKSNFSFADVIDFYETTLPKEGWTKVEADSFVLNDTAVLVYTQGEDKINISISPDDDSTQLILIINE